LAVAAGVVFYGLLALFPAVTALVSLYGLFAKASTINEHLSMAGGFLPESAMSIVHDQVNRLTAKGDAKLGFGFVAGLLIALWSAELRHEGDPRRAQCRLRREGEARLY
jgi:membrane protein